MRQPSFDCKMVQKLLQFRRAHLRWMPLIVKENIFLDPVDIGSLGAQTVVLAANRLSYLIE
jgi:hypothetical protein